MKKSPLKKIGKHGHQWLKTRRKWIKLNPGPWECYLCGRYLAGYLDLALDHIQSRSRHPELRYELDNLAPCCYPCNKAKGSLSLEQYKTK